ncbi:MAG: Family 2 glycosyl transferase [Candidatus Amesbacteria bacterium GW2011_GWB1_47_19]|nr:MAG: Family 2 glycosyl transferase [Candidatus Amesbacteria bacterium GW2011_GWA1_44_24]KKU31363.1 MAG: Family 2 glycosyl transferase [Candidatus Amesbacteria bacterium GW2011_GWC1_46_24]KKU66984.1 MAG: Family 2 glycosyl transferase [Candidatus Amesbacteria bacterium GW2011_GWB1_47_19]HBC72798.1 hypothetical protein [Candidatus Amesbacteria bacterium]
MSSHRLNVVTPIPPSTVSSQLGAGVAWKMRRFITHTVLPVDSSALITLVGWQKLLLTVTTLAFLLSLWFNPISTGIFTVTVLSLIYFIDGLFNLALVSRSMHRSQEITFSPQRLKKLDESDLPVYSILCPMYKESAVFRHFLTSINRLDWPKSKLDVILLLEADDSETFRAVSAINLPKHIRVVIVPDTLPKTKPKACNYGLAIARGKYVVIYDAEDQPDPQQLKKAYLAFQQVNPKVVCLQAKLNYYNPNHNLLTRLFTAEYSLWFDIILPGLQSLGTTIPLGGTSNHFRTHILRQLAGWDAFNVTEDCDLGIRLFLKGYRTAMIDSTTLEEANSHLGNWMRQRSRWIKGYIQTYLVHNRHPLRFWKTRGIHALIFQLVIGGKILFMLINPLLWLATLSYFVFRAQAGPLMETLYSGPIYYLAVLCTIFGNFIFLYYYMLGCARRGLWDQIKYVYLIPVYWFLISLAGLKAVYQLIVKPHYWEKTHHGLHLAPRQKSRTFRLGISLPHVPVPGGWRPQPSPGLVLVTATIIANFINFVYNVFLGRVLSVADYGLIGFAAGLIYISQIPLGAVARTVSHRSAYLLGRHRLPTLQFWLFTRSRALTISLLVTVAWIITIPGISYFFRLESVLPLLLITPLWPIAALLAVDSGFLSGNLRFISLSAVILAESVIKLLLTVFLVTAGWERYIYIAIPLATFGALLIAFIMVKRFSAKSVTYDLPRNFLTFPGKFFSSSALVSLSSLIFLSLDVILAKHYLSPEQAGYYTLLSLIGKIVFFAGTLFSQFVNPLVSHSEGAQQNPNRTFYRLLGATIFSSSIALIILGPLGRYTVPFILGSRAIPIIPYLTGYCLAMCSFAMAGAIVSYHQARKHYYFSLLSVFLAILLLAGITLYHRNIRDFSTIILISSGLYLGLVLICHGIQAKLADVTLALRDLAGLFRLLPAPAAGTGGNIRILIFNWRDIRHVWAGGAEVYLHELARRWVTAGHEVTLFCGNDRQHPGTEVIDGIRIIRRGGFYTVYIWAVLYYLFRFRGHYDIIIDSENGIPFFTPLYSRIPKFLLIHHVHQDYFIRHVRFPLAQIAKFLEAGIAPLVYHNQPVITVSESSRKDIAALGLARTENISVINPGIDLRQFLYQSPKTSYPSFLYLGRVRPYKQIDIAVRAFARILTDHPDARLNIAGDGESIKSLRALTDRLGIETRVSFLGRVSDKERIHLLSSSWAMLQPSSFEGWGITVIEANICSTPVIASNVVGLRDSVRDGQTGLLVPNADVSALTAAMGFLIRHSDVRRQLSAQAGIWARHFDWDIQAASLLCLIRSRFGEKLSDRHPGQAFVPAS